MFQITFRNMPSTSLARELAELKFAHLASQARGTASCILVLEHQSGCSRKNEQYCAHLDLRTASARRLHATVEAEHTSTAIRDVFALVERQLASRHAGSHRSID